jgi:Rib/alpha/Esp surface antigen-like repeat protein
MKLSVVSVPTAAIAFLSMCIAAFASELSPPYNLGTPGLELELRLWRYDQGSGWEAADASAIVTTDLGTGEYLFSQLPEASGKAAYVLVVALTASPSQALATYTYGAVPGQINTWRMEYRPMSSPFVFKTNDTYALVYLVVASGLPAAIGNAETSAIFTMLDVTSGEATIEDRAATISNVTLDAGTGTYGATLTWDGVQEGDFSTPGQYMAEFEITYPDGRKQTVPADNRLRVEIISDFDGE